MSPKEEASASKGRLHDTQWRTTQEKKQELANKNRSGCIMWLGYLVVFFSIFQMIIFAISFSEATSLELGSIPTMVSLRESKSLFILLFVTVFGCLLAYIPFKKSLEYLDKLYKEIGQTEASEYDKVQLGRWNKFRKKTDRMWLMGTLSLFICFALTFSFQFLLKLNMTQQAASNQPMEFSEFFLIGIVASGLCGFISIVRPVFSAMSLYLSVGAPITPGMSIDVILKDFFTDVQYDNSKGLPRETIEDTHLINIGNLYKSNSLVEGTYRGILFSQADVTYGLKTKDNSETDFFSGRWVIVQAPKPLDGVVYIFTKSFINTNTNYIKKANLEKVEIEDIAFNGKFEIYAQVPHDVFYLLTPALVEHLKFFAGLQIGQSLLEGIGVYCYKDKIHFAVNGVSDSFSMLYIGTMTEHEVRARIKRDISLTTDILDTFVSSENKNEKE